MAAIEHPGIVAENRFRLLQQLNSCLQRQLCKMLNLLLQALQLIILKQRMQMIGLIHQIINHPPLPVVLQQFFRKYKIRLADYLCHFIITVIKQPEP
ncbi:hypothetical protein D3C73_1176470 [compost metagenome]